MSLLDVGFYRWYHPGSNAETESNLVRASGTLGSRMADGNGFPSSGGDWPSYRSLELISTPAGVIPLIVPAAVSWTLV